MTGRETTPGRCSECAAPMVPEGCPECSASAWLVGREATAECLVVHPATGLRCMLEIGHEDGLHLIEIEWSDDDV